MTELEGARVLGARPPELCTVALRI